MDDFKRTRVFKAETGDPDMLVAFESARATFGYFWREVAWERRRIIPALSLAAVKAPFTDGDKAKPRAGVPQVEHMWLDRVEFDGRVVSGVLLNRPNWLKTVRKGDRARFPLAEISDWMYAIGNDVFGAYTVNLLRSRMDAQQLRDHDGAWGRNFGDATKIRVVPETVGTGEHPMSEALASSLLEQLTKNPTFLTDRNDAGWTLLHHQALAGSAATVKVLLEAGADPTAVTDHGMTPRQLAEALGWDAVVALLPQG